MSLGINTKPHRRTGRDGKRTAVRIDRPIFITGLGRSGTTIIHTMLSTHPRVNWLSLLTAKYPDRPQLNQWLMRCIDVPLLGAGLRRRFVPLENYAFWNHYFCGFGAPCRDLSALDVDLHTKSALRAAVGALLTPNRNRLLAKLTGVPRIAFLHEVFPDAKFVHVIRDGRAVANSRMMTSFWKGWQGLNLWAGAMPERYREEWARHDYSFVALAGIEWKTHLDQFEDVKRKHPEIDIKEVRYEAFCADPVDQLRIIAGYCDLGWERSFEQAMRRRYVESANDKWRAVLTGPQQMILEDVLHCHLLRYGYEVGH